MEDTIGCKNDEYTDDEEMFKPRKRRVSEFKTLPWAKQMYSIERYIQSGMYPYFMVRSSFRSTHRDFRWMVKGHFIVDKERQLCPTWLSLTSSRICTIWLAPLPEPGIHWAGL